MINAGKYRHQLKIQVRATERDSAGGVSTTWVDFAVRRCAVRRTPGREVFASAARQGRVPVVFELRYVADVTTAMRAVFDGRVHNILSAVDQEGKREELIVTAEELEGEVP